MAAALASSTAPFQVGTTNASTSVPVPLPSGVVAGDVCVVWSMGFLTGFPSGWTLAAGQTGAGGGFRAFVRVCDGTEGASVTMALFDVGSFAASRLTGVDGTTPLDVTPAETTTGYTGSPPALAVTTVTDAALVLTVIAGGPGDGAVPITAVGASYTLAFHAELANAYWALASKTQATAGDTGTFNWTTGGAGWFPRTLAFRPSSSPPPLAAGTLSESSHTGASAVLAWTSASGGTPAYAAQLQKSPSGAGTWTNVTGATSSPATVTGLARSTAYDFRVVFTDAASGTATSNTVAVTTAATTAFVTNQAGNWSSASIWTPPSVPTAGDTARVAHNVTLDVSATIGASGVTGTAALTVADGATLTPAAGARLTARGDVVTQNHFELAGAAPVGIAFLAGSGLRFDVPTGQEYGLQIGHVGGLAGWTAAGTQASPVVIDKIGAGRAVIRNGGSVCGTFAGTWVAVSGLGDATTPAWTASMADVAGCTFALTDATFTGCGAPVHFDNVGPAATVSLVRLTTTGGVGANGLFLGSLAGPSSPREVQGCSLDQTAQFYPAYGVRVRDSYLGMGHDLTGTPGVAWTGNFFRLPAPDGIHVAGDLTDNVVYLEGAIDNPHPFLVAPVAGRIAGNLFSFPEATIPTDSGDMLIITSGAAAPVDILYENNLVLPIATGPKAGYSPGVTSSQGGNANITIRLRHNTTVGRSATLARVQETTAGHVGMIAEELSNLVVDPTGSNEAYLAVDIGGLTDAFTPSGLDYNGVSGPGPERAGGGYNAIVTGTRGVDFAAHDVSGDPRFLDPTRNPHTWDAATGGAGTSASLLVRLAANPALIATMRDWCRAGFAPTNPAYATAAHDGTTIGAIAYVASADLAVDALEAAVAYLSADSALAAAAPGGVSDSAPLGADWPYLVLSEPEGDNRNESGGGSIEPLRWQLSVFAKGKAEARAVRRLAVAALQDAPLAFAGGALLHLRAANFGGMKEEDPASGGADCWQEIQFFDVVVGRD